MRALLLHHLEKKTREKERKEKLIKTVDIKAVYRAGRASCVCDGHQFGTSRPCHPLLFQDITSSLSLSLSLYRRCCGPLGLPTGESGPPLSNEKEICGALYV